MEINITFHSITFLRHVLITCICDFIVLFYIFIFIFAWHFVLDGSHCRVYG